MTNMKKNGFSNTNCDVLIIGGMRFQNINACTHRMSEIAELFKPYCDGVFLLGVGDSEESGLYNDFEYKTIVYPKTTTQWCSFTFSSKNYISFIKSHPNIRYVVVNGSVPSFPTIKIANYCKRHHIAFVFDIGEWYTSEHKLLKRIVKDFDIFIKMHWICKKYRNYIVASSFLANHCGCNNKNVLILPTIVSAKLIVEAKKQSNDFVTLSFVGTIEKNNLKENLSPLIGAIETFNNSHKLKFRLNIVGCDGENSNWIIYHGRKVYSECVNYVAQSDFTVIPRNKTRKNQSGFPTKLSESFLYDVPVISTDTSDIKKYVINGQTGFLIPSNTQQAFIDCFEIIEKEMLEDSEYLIKLSRTTKEKNKLKIEYFETEFGLFKNKIQ